MMRTIWNPGINLFAALAILLVSFVGHSATAQEPDQQTLKKITAFAKAFGYARYFHPSDQAGLVAWDKMALFGVQRVLESDSSEATEDLLSELFSPLVVDLEFYRGEKKPDPELTKVPMKDMLAWQHYGVGVSERRGIYRSTRTNRSKEVAAREASPFANTMQMKDPTELRGKEIRFRFQARVKEGKCRLQGWLRVDRTGGEQGFFDNRASRANSFLSPTVQRSAMRKAAWRLLPITNWPKSSGHQPRVPMATSIRSLCRVVTTFRGRECGS